MSSTEATDSYSCLHRQIVSYWQSRRLGESLPFRAALEIGSIRHWLSNLSLLSFDASGRARFVLVGSHLRHVLGFEPRGVLLNAVEGLCPRAWHEGTRAALVERRPFGGITLEGGEIRHVWLRLPLLADPAGLAGPASESYLVLCHDIYPGRERVNLPVPDLFDVPQPVEFSAVGSLSKSPHNLAA